MAAGIRWRKAVAVSVLLHCIVLTAVGWMVAKHFTVHDTPEQYVELDLVNEFYGQETSASDIPAGAIATNNTPAASLPESGRASHLSKKSMPTVIASGNNMSVLSVESGGGALDETGGSSGAGGRTSTGAGGGGSAPGSGLNGAGVPGRSGGIIKPGILSRVDPDYPEQARQSGWEGTVVLSIQILPNGRPGNVSVYRSSGYDVLDDAAVAAVRQWRFIPAKERDSGQSIACHTTMPVVFKLRS